MLVETFECEDVSSEHPQMEHDAVALIAELGLTGQQELLTPTESGQEKRFPYRQLTTHEWFVIKSLCPEKFKVESYNNSPIPLRVLQVIAHCRAENYFDGVFIWDRQSAEVKDPFLVGIIGPEYSPKQRFLLARWGEELDAWPIMAKKALGIWRQRMTDKVAEAIAEATSLAAMINSMGIDSAAKKSGEPEFHWN